MNLEELRAMPQKQENINNPNFDISKFDNFDDRIMAAELDTEEEKILHEKLNYLESESKKADNKERALFLMEKLGSGLGYGEFTDMIIRIRDILENKLVDFAEDKIEIKELRRSFRSGSSANEAAAIRIIEESNDFDEIWREIAKNELYSEKIKNAGVKKLMILAGRDHSKLETIKLISTPGSEEDKEINKRLSTIS